MKNLLLLIVLTTTAMTAQNHVQPTVDVTGKGKVTVIPDEVTITARIENTGSDATQVKRMNDKVIDAVFSFLKSQKINDKHIQTEYIRVSKNYEYNTKTYNFSANQAVTIKLVNLKKYESVMDGLLNTGINRIDGVAFSSSKNDTLKTQARKLAVENAKQKATDYASVLGQSIGKAVRISEFKQSYNAPSPPMIRSTMMDSEAGGMKTMAPGELEIVTTVNVSFVLH